ncbi:hypothetical protein KYG33_08670 [Chryseobacterium sp. D764]|jgi:hypothetical protein|uniref:hypothetical protein n=1 Tax=unclassified Chryseobacterium TaxID=2593645 RepID=UPI0009877E63|nr:MULTISPECIES: hypothetical protein [unclassified Chryseobacterium]QXU51098.1 hypothetical protein KYG33_08670 [Chryseobacterium sp. D764]CAD0220538.1 conserved exported protein of unknown function [Chryseobacterium sp. JV274]
MKNLLLALLFLLAGIQAQAQIQIQKNEIEKNEKKSISRTPQKTAGKKLPVKSLKNKDRKKMAGHSNKNNNVRKKEHKKSDQDKTESIVIYEKSYTVKYGVYLFMNLDADESGFSETLVLRDI